ncbi:hypothetical protein [Sinimarinibacterium thermocellulolyticum]|uniref:Secreted protein n=1 Tax=Sinimarinibacterium thermocellulolyticum TaxID=3170016 RepID=A0ABV2AE16_9GAMM
MLRTLLWLAGVGLPALASAQTDLERCAAIEAAAERLACFDALTRTPGAREPDAPQVQAGAAPAAVERFGAESLPAAAAAEPVPDRIEARLKGRFAGWGKDTVFELDNGQVWQCRNCREVYHQAESPRVVIRRSFTGVYWLKVEGLNQQAKVRRVK